MHDNSSKDTSSNTAISLQRQLVYYDSLSNATLSLLLFLHTTFGRKKIKHNYSYKCNLTLRVHCGVIFGGVLDCVKCFDLQRCLLYHFSSVIVYLVVLASSW